MCDPLYRMRSIIITDRYIKASTTTTKVKRLSMFGSLKNKLSQKFHDMERKLILILYNLKAFQKEVSVNVYKYVE